jgi:hypothetical protein
MKQRIDIPRAMAHKDLSSVSEQALQKLGFRLQPLRLAREEDYLPPDRRSPARSRDDGAATGDAPLGAVPAHNNEATLEALCSRLHQALHV